MRFKAFSSRAEQAIWRLAVILACAGLLTSACGPKADDGLVWSEWEDGGTLNLQHGPEESDNLTIQLRCVEGSGRVKIEVPVAAAWRAGKLSLRSGSAKATWPARFQADGEIMEGWAVTEVPAGDPVLTAFAETGRLSGKDIGDLDAPLAEERRTIDRFFKICG